MEFLEFIDILAVPGHALLWLIPVQRKRTKREVAHVSNTLNVPMPVGKQYFCGSIFCADIYIVWLADLGTRNTEVLHVGVSVHCMFNGTFKAD
jgi:hypothetical protein